VPVKKFSNFVVIKAQFTYIVFWSGGYVNVANLKAFSDLELAKKEFQRLTGILLLSKWDVQNIHAHGQIDLKRRSLSWIVRHSNPLDGKLLYDRSFFPGLRLKFPEGTIVIWQSGKYSALGVRDLNSLEKLVSKCAIISQQW